MMCEVACRRAKERLDDYNRRNFTVRRGDKWLQLCTIAYAMIGQLQLRQQQAAIALVHLLATVVTRCQS